MYVHSLQFLNVREAISEARQSLHALVDTVLDVAEVNIEVGSQLPRPLALDLSQVVNEAHLRGGKPLTLLVLSLLARGVGHQALAPEFVVAADLVIIYLVDAAPLLHIGVGQLKGAPLLLHPPGPK